MAPRWAPGDTLAGRLQRGTGTGYRLALEAGPPVARSLLLDCITHDPRWDSQVESRAWYYAGLAGEFGLPAVELIACLRTRAGTAKPGEELVIDTLGEMAVCGDIQAVAALLDYVRWGAEWTSALISLIECRDSAVNDSLGSLVVERWCDEEDFHWLADDEEPWLTWSRRHPEIRTALDACRAERAAVRAAQSPDRFAGDPVPALFERADRDTYVAAMRALRNVVTPQDLPVLTANLRSEAPWRCKLALWGLGLVGGEESFTAWRTFLDRSGELPTMLRSAVHGAARNFKGEAALATGREWFEAPDFPRRRLGERLLAQTATKEDVPRLSGAIREAIASGEMYRLCSVSEGLERIGAPEAWPELAFAFNEALYSFARGRLVRAMLRASPDRFAQEAAIDAQRDCEEGVRERAAAALLPG